MKMAVTTSFENSGSGDVLLSAIKNDLEYRTLQLLVWHRPAMSWVTTAGTSMRCCAFAPAAEEAFVASGTAPTRREDYVITTLS